MGALWECPQIIDVDGHAFMVSSAWEGDVLVEDRRAKPVRDLARLLHCLPDVAREIPQGGRESGIHTISALSRCHLDT